MKLPWAYVASSARNGMYSQRLHTELHAERKQTAFVKRHCRDVDSLGEVMGVPRMGAQTDVQPIDAIGRSHGGGHFADKCHSSELMPPHCRFKKAPVAKNVPQSCWLDDTSKPS